jgi:hypothetical protein
MAVSRLTDYSQGKADATLARRDYIARSRRAACVWAFVPTANKPEDAVEPNGSPVWHWRCMDMAQYWNSIPTLKPWAQKSLWWNTNAGRASPSPLPKRGSRGTCAALTVVSISLPGRATWLQYRN